MLKDQQQCSDNLLKKSNACWCGCDTSEIISDYKLQLKYIKKIKSQSNEAEKEKAKYKEGEAVEGRET